MAIQTISASAITAQSQLLYTTAGSIRTRTYVEWSYTGDSAIYLDVAGAVRVEPRTRGIFDLELKTISVHAVAKIPTSGSLSISAIDNTDGSAKYGLNAGQVADSVLPTDKVQLVRDGGRRGS